MKWLIFLISIYGLAYAEDKIDSSKTYILMTVAPQFNQSAQMLNSIEMKSISPGTKVQMIKVDNDAGTAVIVQNQAAMPTPFIVQMNALSSKESSPIKNNPVPAKGIGINNTFYCSDEESRQNPSSPFTQKDPPSSFPGADQVRSISSIADQARGGEIVKAAETSLAETRRAAEADQETTSGPYRSMPLEDLAQHMERAKTNLAKAASVLESASGGLEPSERARFRNLFMNAGDKAAFGKEAIEKEITAKNSITEPSLFKNFLPPNPFGKSTPFSSGDILGPQSAAATSNDGLVSRLIQFNGLPPDQRAQMLKKLKLVDPTPFRFPSGDFTTIPILHNGYILGGSPTGVDCSTFVSAALPSDVRKGRFNTMDFRMMWIYKRKGKFPRPPEYTAAREKLIKQTAEAFTAVDLYEGEKLAVGDLLIYRLIWEPNGHVFIVKDFDPKTLETEVIEAAQSAGTIRERRFPITLDPPTQVKRYIRPGLFVLRLRPVSNRACTYRDPNPRGA